MNDNLRRYICVIIVISIPIQLYLNYMLKRKINEKPVISNVCEVKYKDLTQLNKELSFLNNYIILNANKDNNIWYIKLKLYGNRQEIIEEMKKLETYKVKNYIIIKNNTENCVIMDIYSN